MELELIYNEETQKWEEKSEPFATIEVETEEDFEFIGNAIAFYKKHMDEQANPQTNADRIRAMSDEELSTLLCDISDCSTCRWGQFSGCVVREWLKQPAEEE